MDYLPGESQPGNWLNGVGGGIMYHSPSDRWKIMLDYGYGIDAIRSHGRGANSIGLLLQMDLGKLHGEKFNSGHSPSTGAAGSGCSAMIFPEKSPCAAGGSRCFIIGRVAHMVELADTLL